MHIFREHLLNSLRWSLDVGNNMNSARTYTSNRLSVTKAKVYCLSSPLAFWLLVTSCVRLRLQHDLPSGGYMYRLNASHHQMDASWIDSLILSKEREMGLQITCKEYGKVCQMLSWRAKKIKKINQI